MNICALNNTINIANNRNRKPLYNEHDKVV